MEIAKSNGPLPPWQSIPADLFCVYEKMEGKDYKFPHPMNFTIFPPGKETSIKTQRFIIAGGGTFLPYENKEDDPFTITLLDTLYLHKESQENYPVPHDVFSHKFIGDMLRHEHATLDVDLNCYLYTKSGYEDYDANDVLYRRKSWADLTPLITPSPLITRKDLIYPSPIPIIPQSHQSPEIAKKKTRSVQGFPSRNPQDTAVRAVTTGVEANLKTNSRTPVTPQVPPISSELVLESQDENAGEENCPQSPSTRSSRNSEIPKSMSVHTRIGKSPSPRIEPLQKASTAPTAAAATANLTRKNMPGTSKELRNRPNRSRPTSHSTDSSSDSDEQPSFPKSPAGKVTMDSQVVLGGPELNSHGNIVKKKKNNTVSRPIHTPGSWIETGNRQVTATATASANSPSGSSNSDPVYQVSDSDADASSVEAPQPGRTEPKKRGPPNVKKSVPYSKKDGQTILDHILTNQWLDKVSGNLVWQKIEAKGSLAKTIGFRTWQSLRNHWLRTITLDLDEPRGPQRYRISKEHLELYKKSLRAKSTNKRRNQHAL